MSNFGIRYGVSLRKRYLAVKADKQRRYKCDLCGKEAVKREGNAIWRCRHCNATFAGGAYTLKTSAGETVSRILGKE
ncbi:MAG: 50S ribosomal protein L37ae [Candidatus Micrarchaeota archaeon]|nr:50S ribosomal protein L37ae [Candidatus Micrarchaeota archaeon]MDE1859055.1 50S ribosomal protein L37ae [Candidatus Micrarchaeota archaeon]